MPSATFRQFSSRILGRGSWYFAFFMYSLPNAWVGGHCSERNERFPKSAMFLALEASTSPLFRFPHYSRPLPNTVLKMGENLRVGRTSHFEMSKPETRPISVMLHQYGTGTVLVCWVPAILSDAHYSGRNAKMRYFSTETPSCESGVDLLVSALSQETFCGRSQGISDQGEIRNSKCRDTKFGGFP